MKKLLPNIAFSLLFCLGVTRSVAQTSLSAGDMAVLSWSATTNKVQVVTFRDLDAGTVINFTDWGWLWSSGPSAAWAPNSFSGVAEGNIQWTVQSAVPKGTIIEITFAASSSIVVKNLTTNTVISTGPSAANGIAISGLTSTDPMIPNGDNFFIYQGSSSNPKFIFGLDNTVLVASNSPVVNPATGWSDNGAYTTGWFLGSNLPDGTGSQNALTSGVNAVGFSAHTTELAYNGNTAPADAATWLSRIANAANWTTSSTVITAGYGSSLSFTGSTLPLTWLSFTATPKGTGISLNWQTATETNTKDFVVQYSPDGNNWTTIGTVAAAQNSNATQSYTFFHSSPAAGINDYRLLQEDQNGRSAYSKVVTVLLSASRPGLTVYPNPATGGLVHVQLNKASLVQVYNGAGVLVLEKSVTVGANTLELGGLAKGAYWLKANGETASVFVQ